MGKYSDFPSQTQVRPKSTIYAFGERDDELPRQIRLPLSRALERLTIGLRTKSRVGGKKPSSKVESVVILRYLPTRSVTAQSISPH